MNKNKTTSKYMYLHIFRKTEVKGCLMEDGADTREKTTEFLIVPDFKLDKFQEYVANEMGYQDYSYTVDFKEIAIIGSWEAEGLSNKLRYIKLTGGD